jgi:hypothetical protein
MKMGSNDGDNDEGLIEDKPFSPMYPVFNFMPQPLQSVSHPQSLQLPPPAYNYQENKGF